jgi:4'-phosphopantetheinyl transferase
MWTHAPEKLQLTAGAVHLWKVNLRVPPESPAYYSSILSDEEKQRADRFYFEKDRQQYLTGRATLRELLGRYLECPPASIVFEFNEFGKPSVPNGLDLKFNISHSGGLALMGFTLAASIGVDLEKIKAGMEIEQIASRFFSSREKEEILQLPAHRQADAFYQCWTSKEAFIKAHGQGLSLPLDQFEVEVNPDRVAALKAVHWEPELVEQWDLYGFTPLKNFVGAVVCDRKIEEVSFYALCVLPF